MPVKNTLGDLHNLLMAQMERLSDVDDEHIEQEIERSRAMAGLAKGITNNANTIIKAADLASMSGAKPPRILTDGDANEVDT